MNLRDFIAETLVQIQMGVKDAIDTHSKIPGAVGVINPVWGADANAISEQHAQKVEFDIAITVSDKTAGSGKSELRVFSLEMGGVKNKSLENNSVSRVKFSIPIVPAVQIITGK